MIDELLQQKQVLGTSSTRQQSNTVSRSYVTTGILAVSGAFPNPGGTPG